MQRGYSYPSLFFCINYYTFVVNKIIFEVTMFEFYEYFRQVIIFTYL